MLIFLGVLSLVVLGGSVVVGRWVHAASDKGLGSMSEQWLAEHRASNQS